MTQSTWADRLIDRVAASVDTLVSIPPLSWLDRALRGPVGPPK